MKNKIIASAKKQILFLPHALKQMARPDRMISTDDIRQAVFHGEIIETYPEDQRDESYLIFHTSDQRVIHVLCSPKSEYLAIITAYLPAADQWSADFKVRK